MKFSLTQPAVLDNARDIGPGEDAVPNAKLEEVAATLRWFKVLRQVRYQLRVEDSKLVCCSVRDDHLSHGAQLPVVQLLGHPLRNVGRIVTLVKWGTSKHKGLPSPIRSDVV